MIPATQLLTLKGRLLLAVQAGHRMASNGDEPLMMDEQTYQEVAAALLSAPDDLSKILAELDILRGQVSGDWDHIFGSLTKEGQSGRTENVEGVGDDEPGAAEPAVRIELPEVGGDLRPGGADGQKEGGPKPRRNSSKGRKRKSKLDASSGGSQVDSGEEAA